MEFSVRTAEFRTTLVLIKYYVKFKYPNVLKFCSLQNHLLVLTECRSRATDGVHDGAAGCVMKMMFVSLKALTVPAATGAVSVRMATPQKTSSVITAGGTAKPAGVPTTPVTVTAAPPPAATPITRVTVVSQVGSRWF